MISIANSASQLLQGFLLFLRHLPKSFCRWESSPAVGPVTRRLKWHWSKSPCLSIGCLTTRDIQLPRPSAVNDFLVNLALRLLCIDTTHPRDTDSDSFMNGLGVFQWLSAVIQRNTTIINHSLSYDSLRSETDHRSRALMHAPGERNHTPAA